MILFSLTHWMETLLIRKCFLQYTSSVEKLNSQLWVETQLMNLKLQNKVDTAIYYVGLSIRLLLGLDYVQYYHVCVTFEALNLQPFGYLPSSLFSYYKLLGGTQSCQYKIR